MIGGEVTGLARAAGGIDIADPDQQEFYFALQFICIE